MNCDRERCSIAIGLGVGGVVSLVLNVIFVIVIVILGKHCCKQRSKNKVMVNEIDNIGLFTRNLQKYSEDPHFKKEHQQIIDKIDKVIEQLGRVQYDSKDDDLLANTIEVLNEAKNMLDKNARAIPSTQDQEVPVESNCAYIKHMQQSTVTEEDKDVTDNKA